MEIKLIGHACLQLQGNGVTIVTDPYDSKIGFELPDLACDILTISHEHYDHNYREGVHADIVFDSPGEFDFKGARIKGFRTFHDNRSGNQRGFNTMFLFELDGVRVLHCGDLGHSLSDELIDRLDRVDILILPVGGHYTLPPESAADLVRTIQPRIVVPIHFAIPGLKIDQIESADKFLRLLGSTPETVFNLSVTQNSLPEEGSLKIMLLQPQAQLDAKPS